MLIHDDVKVQIQEEKLKPYTPDFSVVETIENENPSENNSIRIEENSKETLTENVQQLAEKYNNSVGWLYIPDTQINYPVMFSGDQRDAGPISRLN